MGVFYRETTRNLDLDDPKKKILGIIHGKIFVLGSIFNLILVLLNLNVFRFSLISNFPIVALSFAFISIYNIFIILFILQLILKGFFNVKKPNLLVKYKKHFTISAIITHTMLLIAFLLFISMLLGSLVAI